MNSDEQDIDVDADIDADVNADINADINTEASQPEAAANLPEAEEDIRLPEKRQGVRLPTVIFWSCLAALMGAGLSIFVQNSLLSNAKIEEMPGVQAQLKQMEADMQAFSNAQTARLDALQTRLLTIEARPQIARASEGDPDLIRRIEALESRAVSNPDQAEGAGAPIGSITALEDRLAVLEAAKPPAAGPSADITPLEERLAALEIGQSESEQSETSRYENFQVAITARIEALENAPPQDIDPVDLSPVTARIDALEAKNAALEAARAAVPVPPFPSEAVITAMSPNVDQEDGWLSRTLNKHVKVRDEAAVEKVAKIEALLAEGRVSAALASAQALPEAGVHAAQEWIDLVKSQRMLP